MKTLRHFFIAAALVIGVLSLVAYSSCKSKCGSTTCQNGGTCSSNACVCPTGYSGNACQTGWSDAAIGTYKCTRANCVPAVPGSNSWLSSITKDASNGGYTIDISNFDNSNITVYATIDSAISGINRITVTPSTTSGIRASGTLENGVINLQFTSTSGGVGGYECNMVLTKQ